MGFLDSFINFLNLIVSYIGGIIGSIIGFFELIFESSTMFAVLVGYLPNFLQISGMAVVSIAIFKAVFGRQGAS